MHLSVKTPSSAVPPSRRRIHGRGVVLMHGGGPGTHRISRRTPYSGSLTEDLGSRPRGGQRGGDGGCQRRGGGSSRHGAPSNGFSAPPMFLFSYAIVVTRSYLHQFRLRRGVLQDLVEKRRCGTHVPTHSTLLTLCTPTCSISVEEILLPLSILTTTSQGISHWSNFCSGIWRRFRRLNLAESKTEHS